MRINKVQKAIKDQGACMACRLPIKKGEPYKWFQFFRRAKMRYHINCRIPGSHTTSNEKHSSVLAEQEALQDQITGLTLEEGMSDEELTEAYNALVSQTADSIDAVQNVIDEYDESISNLESVFQSGSSQIDEMTEYKETIENWLIELEEAQSNLESFSPEKDRWEELQDAVYKMQGAVEGLSL